MEADRPFIEQMRESIPSGEEVQTALTDTATNVGASITNIK